MVGHEFLLVHRAMVLQRQDDWILGGLEEQRGSNEDLNQQQNAEMREIKLSHFEGVVFDGFDDVPEEHFGGDGVTMVDNRLAVGPVPAVELHAAAALHQRSAR